MAWCQVVVHFRINPPLPFFAGTTAGVGGWMGNPCFTFAMDGDIGITPVIPNVEQAASLSLEDQVLNQLRNIIDPDFGEDIVACGFIKNLVVDAGLGRVSLTIELTTPACPIKEVFQRQANEFVKVRGEGLGPLILFTSTICLVSTCIHSCIISSGSPLGQGIGTHHDRPACQTLVT